MYCTKERKNEEKKSECSQLRSKDWCGKRKYFSVIGQHLLDNHECAKKYKKENFSVLVREENSFQLHILEALCIQSLRPSLCKQKKFVYQSRLLKSLY